MTPTEQIDAFAKKWFPFCIKSNPMHPELNVSSDEQRKRHEEVIRQVTSDLLSVCKTMMRGTEWKNTDTQNILADAYAKGWNDYRSEILERAEKMGGEK
jgi:hypothetical protein